MRSRRRTRASAAAPGAPPSLKLPPSPRGLRRTGWRAEGALPSFLSAHPPGRAVFREETFIRGWPNLAPLRGAGFSFRGPIRGCRYAQPPATVWQPSGLAKSLQANNLSSQFLKKLIGITGRGRFLLARYLGLHPRLSHGGLSARRAVRRGRRVRSPFHFRVRV